MPKPLAAGPKPADEIIDLAGQVDAISKSQAIASFSLDGKILSANQNFLDIFGYTMAEIAGRHHRMFVEPDYAGSPAYRHFWSILHNGQFQAAEFKRIGKDGREIWLQASYNPILGFDGRPSKIMKFATDVTERKRNEAAFVAQVDAIAKSQAVIEFALDGTVLTANQNYLAVLGYGLDEIIGRHHGMFVAPFYRETAAYGAFWDSLRNGAFHTGEFARIGKAGREVWLQATYNPIMDLHGHPYKVVKFATDITARKREQEEMRQSAARLALATDSGGIGIWDWDIVNNVMLWDAWMCRIYGVLPEPAAIRDTYELWSHRLHPEDRQAAEQAVADAIAGLRPFDTGFRVVWRDGTLHHIRATGEITRDSAGVALRMVGVNWDVTAQVEQNRALREVTTRMMLAADGGGLGILEIDIKNNMMAADEWACRIFGIPYLPGAAIPGDIWKLRVHPDDRARHDEACQDAIDGLAPYELEYRIIREDGVTRHLKCSAVVTRDMAGEALRMTGSVQDITARRDIEDALAVTASELKRSNEELDLFASIASHDLQEPLRMVASYLQLISKRYKGKLDADADEFIDYAVDGAKRMQRLIQDLLAYSRVGTKGMELRHTEAEAAFAGAILNLQGAIEQSGAKVTHGQLPSVLADESQLTQLFQNLVGNAIKYRNGATPVIHVSAAPVAGGQWRFVVHDNGLGIDAQHFERIFGMFQRLHSVDEYSGTGIGLAICKKIVDRHGGVIGVDSKPGEGSAFHFTLAGMAPDGINAQN